MHASGDRLADYRLTDRVGSTQRELWRAVDVRDDKPTTIVVLPHLQDAVARERFERDAEALRALAHPAIMTVESIEDSDGGPIVRMVALGKTNLTECVHRGGLEAPTLLASGALLADGIRAAHDAGVTHRELAPDRVYVGDDGTMRIEGFGLSATDEGGEDPNMDPDDTPTLTLTREGSRRDLSYLSPEQIKNLPLDRTTDVYSMGAILYWMAAGVHPFHGDSPADLFVAVLRDTPRPVNQLRHDIPEGLVPIIDRCLQKERNRRYAGATDLHAALSALV